MTSEEVRKIELEEPKAKPPADLMSPIQSTFLEFPDGEAPGLSTKFKPVFSSTGKTVWKLDVAVSGIPSRPEKPGPMSKLHVVPSELDGVRGPLTTEPYIPDFAELNPIPKNVQFDNRQHIFYHTDGEEVIPPGAIFPPDARSIYYDLSYPWHCVGLIISSSYEIWYWCLGGPKACSDFLS